MKTMNISNIGEGTVIPLEEVKDPNFSSGLMGVGYGLIPTTSQVYAPLSGQVSVVFSPQHALGIVTPDGIEVLIHMGIKTANLPAQDVFSILVEEGDVVERGQPLADFYLDRYVTFQEDSTIVVVLTSMDRIEKFELNKIGYQKKDALLAKAWY